MSRSLIPWRRNREDVPVRREEENPFLDLHQRMNDLFEDFFSDFEGFLRTPGSSLVGRRQSWAMPSVDMTESDDAVTVTADLPGLTEKDVEVTLDDNLLVIRGSRKEEREEKKQNYRVMERTFGEFHRAIPVPEGVDRDKVKATFKNGVLKLEMPKKPEAKGSARKIENSAA